MHSWTTVSASRTTRVERLDTVVVGGGQAGLAAGYHLAARDVDFVILDAGARVGDAWRRRWDSLRLFTPAAYSALPGMCFPAPPAHLPDKDQVADYLERYAEHFDLPVRPSTRIDALEWGGERYVLRANGVVYEADNVVVATGPFQRPRTPAVAAGFSPAIHQLHSSEYVSPFGIPEGDVLVVGAGNSGAQIAMELARFRRVWLAGRDTGHLPRRLLGRDLFDWLWPIMSRATVDTSLGKRMHARARRSDPLIGIPARDIAAAGVARVGRVTGERGGFPLCEGERVEPRVIVWCTGFTPDFGWIRLPAFDADGQPKHRRGIASDWPGLYFVGLRYQQGPTSALIGGVGRDAEVVAEQVARRSRMGEAVAAM
jgi:putative flavoprotein involved in K+ transport